jgi:hypothetical protein
MNSEISVLLKHFCTFVLVSSTISKIRGIRIMFLETLTDLGIGNHLRLHSLELGLN